MSIKCGYGASSSPSRCEVALCECQPGLRLAALSWAGKHYFHYIISFVYWLFFFPLKGFIFNHKIWSYSNLFWTSSPQKGSYFKFVLNFPITLICLLVGKQSDRQAGLKSTKFSLDLYYHWTPARGWGNGRLKAERRAEDPGEMGSLWKSKRENRGLQNKGPTLKPGRCRKKKTF